MNMEENTDLTVSSFKKPRGGHDSCQKMKTVATKREFLKPREDKVDFESKVNTTQIIPRINGKARVGQYCELCEYAATDSANYYDHINGKQHQQNMNMSMRIQRSTLEEVKRRFEANSLKKQGKYRSLKIQEIVDILKRKAEKKEDHEAEEDDDTVLTSVDIEDEEGRIRDNRRQERKRGVRRKFEPIEKEESEDDDGMASIMGLNGFGGSKRNH